MRRARSATTCNRSSGFRAGGTHRPLYSAFIFDCTQGAEKIFVSQLSAEREELVETRGYILKIRQLFEAVVPGGAECVVEGSGAVVDDVVRVRNGERIPFAA